MSDNLNLAQLPFAIAARRAFSRMAEDAQGAVMSGVATAEPIMDFCDATVARLVELRRDGASEQDILLYVKGALEELTRMTGWRARTLAEAA